MPINSNCWNRIRYTAFKPLYDQIARFGAQRQPLDTYHAERHPDAARMLRNTMAQVALLRTDERTDALREIMSEFLGMD